MAVLSYIPFESGYFLPIAGSVAEVPGKHQEDRRPALRFDGFLDNGSGPETVRALHELKETGTSRLLVLSESNLGKGGAWNFIFDAAPGEILAYSDSDALFYPGWLSSSVELLEAFPNAGMITARPFRTLPESL